MTKILLVEDDKSLREIYGVRLLAEGYDIVSAGDGEEALAMAIKERPTLIISDVMMPKISGFDMLDILRSTTETKSIKVIMMTALSSEEQRLRGESLGADKYLVKSQVGIEDVVRVVHEVLDDQPTTAGAGFASSDYAAPQVIVPERTPSFAAPAPVAQDPTVPTPAPGSQSVSATPPPSNAFDTPRPNGSGERIIQPLPSSENPTTPPDINELLNKELAAEAAASVPVSPPAPVETEAAPIQPSQPSFESTPVQTPAPAEPVVAEPVAPTPQTDLQYQQAPQPAPVEPSFIETPALVVPQRPTDTQAPNSVSSVNGPTTTTTPAAPAGPTPQAQ